jgi:hypothetical protein
MASGIGDELKTHKNHMFGQISARRGAAAVCPGRRSSWPVAPERARQLGKSLGNPGSSDRWHNRCNEVIARSSGEPRTKTPFARDADRAQQMPKRPQARFGR